MYCKYIKLLYLIYTYQIYFKSIVNDKDVVIPQIAPFQRFLSRRHLFLVLPN